MYSGVQALQPASIHQTKAEAEEQDTASAAVRRALALSQARDLARNKPKPSLPEASSGSLRSPII